MRAALLILLGLAIGIVGTVFAMNALRQRNPLPKAVMSVMAHHMGTLQQARKAQRCEAAANLEQLQRLRSASLDIGDAFPDAPQDFTATAGHLHDALQAAIQAAPADCPALAAALKPVGDACESCHRQYR